jgi:hypothetical protein
MNTDARELTDKELYENESLAVEYDRVKVIANDGYGKLKDIVFTAVILGFGAIVWTQQGTNAQIERDIAVLKLACLHNPEARIPASL